MTPQRSEKEKDTGRSQKGFERGKSRGPSTQHGVESKQDHSNDQFENEEQGYE